MKLLATHKDSKANARIGVLSIIIGLLFSFLTATSATAAASFCCYGSVVVSQDDPSSVTLELHNGAPFAVEGMVTISSELGSSASPVTLNPATTLDPDALFPGTYVPEKTVDGPYRVPFGSTITVDIGGTLIGTYTNVTPVITVRDIYAERPVSNGTVVFIPSATADYYYKNVTTGLAVSGEAPIPANGSLVIDAELSNPKEGDNLIAGPWTFDYVTPAPIMAMPPSAPDFQDNPGRGQDRVVLSGQEGWVYTINDGPTRYYPGDVVPVSGLVTVNAKLADGYAVRTGSNVSYQWTHGFSGGGDRPADDGDIKKVVICHATGSETNPYVRIEPSVNTFFNEGHGSHAGDIWAAFSFWKGGEEIHVAAQGDQAILAIDCAVTLTPNPDPGTDPAPGGDPDPKPGTDPVPGNDTDPKPGNDPVEDGGNTDPKPGTNPVKGNKNTPNPVTVNNPAPVGNPDPQVKTVVDSQPLATEEEGSFGVYADTAAGEPASGHNPTTWLFAAAGLIVLATATFRRRQS